MVFGWLKRDTGKDKGRFRVRKLWFEDEYWVYDVVGGSWLTCFSSREDAEKLCFRMNSYFSAINDE